MGWRKASLERRKESISAYQKEYYRKHKEQKDAYSLKWQEQNREKYREYQREYHRKRRKNLAD